MPQLADTTTNAQVDDGYYSKWFVIITAVFITCLITANIIAVKLVSLAGFILPAATSLTYWVVNFLKRNEELDVYDDETRFNPLLVTE